MPNTRETLRALVSAFNVNNYDFNAVKTNFKLQSEGKKDYIVVSFEKSMDKYQCKEYLDSIKSKIVGEFYDVKGYEVALNTGKSIFDAESFPFDINKGGWFVGEQGRIEFVTPIDQGVIFNLKSHLTASLAKDVLEGMPTCNFFIKAPNKKGYLWHGEFPNEELCQQFGREFLFRMRERYENVPKDPLKVKGNSVYIKDVFDDARFIDNIIRRAAWRIGIDLGVSNDVDHSVMLLKDSIINSFYQSTKIIVVGFICTSPLNREEASILIPLVLGGGGKRILTSEEALKLNYAFDSAVFYDLYNRTQGELSVNGDREKYGIDFSNPEISHCVITKIIESSVINKDHELAIDPELRFRALSPAQSPVRMPNGPSSGLTELSPPIQEFPTRDQNVAKDSPRQGSGTEKGLLERMHNQLGLAVAGPSAWVSSTAVSDDVPGPSSSVQSVSAVQDVPIWTGASLQPMSRWSSPAPSAGLSSMPPSRPSSWEIVGKSGSATSQPIVSWSSPGLCAQSNDIVPWLQPSTQMSSPAVNTVMIEPKKCVGAAQNVPTWTGANSSSSQGTSGNRWTPSMKFTQPGPIDLSRKQSGPSSLRGANERRTSDKPLTEKEKELFKELLYAFNLNNHILECPHTNFIVENGKIASSINDGVDVKGYLQKVRDYTIKEYCGTEEEAKEACDLNEFPFKFLSNYEKNQEITVVANMSCGALLNLKKLFIQGQGHKEEVEIEDIDINIVKKAVKSKKDEWVDSQVKGRMARPYEAITTCYPDESELKHIPIIKDKGGYCLDRTYSTKEVKSFVKERRCAKGISVAGKVNPEDNRDSGISSGEATDAENVSSKAEATTSGYESMDCENTRGGLPKRKSPSPEDGGNPRKSPKRDSLPLSRLESLSLSSSSHQIGKC